MAFEAFPLVIQLFPVLIIESAAISFIITLGIKGRLLNPEKGATGWTLKHLKHFLYVALGGPYIGMVLVAIIWIFANTLWLDVVFNSLRLLLHLEIVVLAGVVVGLMLAAAYVHRGVSAFVIIGSLLMLLPNILLPSDSAAFAIGFALDGLDGMVIFMLVWGICDASFLKRLLGEMKVSENAEASIMKTIACAYITDALRKLERRVEVDNDEIAKQTISEIMQPDGLAARLTTDAAASPEKGKGLGQEKIKREPSRGNDSGALYEQIMLSSNIRPDPKPSGTWILTDSEFKRRVRMNRGLLLFSLSVISVLGLIALLNINTQTNQWTFLLCTGLIVTSIPLAFFDNSFMQRRLSPEMATRDVMTSLIGVEKIVFRDEAIEMLPDLDSQIVAERFEDYEPSPATGRVEMVTTKHLKGTHKKSKAFLKRVIEGKDDVYEESVQLPYIIVVGFAMVFPTGMSLLLADSHHLPGLYGTLVIIMTLGLLILFGGILRWFRLTKSHSFHGIRRSWLSTALSYLEAKEAGIEDVGIIVYPKSPNQFAFLKFAGPNTAKRTLESLNKDTLIKEDYKIAVDALEVEGKIVRMILCFVPVLLLVTLLLFPAFFISGMTELPTIWLLGMAMGILLMLAPYVDYRRKRRRVERQNPEESRDEPVEQFEHILTLLRTEYDYPLRLLVVGNHQELLYTGRIFTTSTDVKMQEAVFLPSKASSTMASKSEALQ